MQPETGRDSLRQAEAARDRPKDLPETARERGVERGFEFVLICVPASDPNFVIGRQFAAFSTSCSVEVRKNSEDRSNNRS